MLPLIPRSLEEKDHRPIKRARDLIELVDNSGLSLQNKNRVKNMLGRMDCIGRLYDAYIPSFELGILIPQARPTSAFMTIDDDVSFDAITFSATLPQGTLYVVESDVFRFLLDIGKPVVVNKRSLNKMPFVAQGVDLYVLIRKIRCECCCLEDCKPSKGFSTILIELKSDIRGGRLGICIMCNAHANGLKDDAEIMLPIGGSVYLFQNRRLKRLAQ